jgi:formylglycine-generating enzyme required for sulfatase activity
MGVGIRVCTICGETDPNTTIPVAHSWGEWAIATAPTCTTTTGVGIRLCIICNATDPNTVIPVIGHVFVSGFCTRTQCFMMEMADIPDGNFVRNGHTITLSAFRMSKFQVTQELYQAVMGNNPSWFHGGADREPTEGEVQGRRPVERVRWFDAIIFCNRLSIREGLTPAYEMQTIANTWSSDHVTWDGMHSHTRRDTVRVVANATGYRLPTEAQWEYACRAGSDPTWNWHFGNAESQLVNYAWYSANSNWQTRQVGLKLPNAWGLHDMHGNVREWCWDWWNSEVPFPNPADLVDPTGAASDSNRRVIRGGNYGRDAWASMSASRDGLWPDGAMPMSGVSYGFRFVRP